NLPAVRSHALSACMSTRLSYRLITQRIWRGAEPLAVKGDTMTSQQTLADMATALVSGQIEIVDLTAPLGPDTPILYLPPDFAKNTPKFKMHEISAYDQNGPW